jgi:hypothetical protein
MNELRKGRDANAALQRKGEIQQCELEEKNRCLSLLHDHLATMEAAQLNNQYTTAIISANALTRACSAIRTIQAH